MFRNRCFHILFVIFDVSSLFDLNQRLPLVDKQGLRNGNINVSLFLENFEGTVLYAMTRNSRLLIKFEKKEAGKKYLLVKSVNYTKRCAIEDLCGCHDCDVKHLMFVVNLGGSEISINCNGRINNITMIYSDLQDDLKMYPSNKYINNTKETVIWMRDVGPYKSKNGPYYHKINSILKGCLDYFYLNGKSIENDEEKHLLTSCNKSFPEIICNRSNCSTAQIPINVYDCFSLILYEKICKKEIPIYTPNHYYYISSLQNTVPVQISIKWQTNSDKNYCLLEIDYRDRSSMILFHDGTGKIIMQSVKNVTQNDTPVKLNNITNAVIYVLSIGFTKNELEIRMAFNQTIYTFTEKISSEPIIIRFGYSTYSNKCMNFAGYLDIQYNYKLFMWYQKVSNLPVKATYSSVRRITYIILVSISTGVLLVLIFIWFFKRQSTSHHSSNISYKKRVSDDVIEISLPILEENDYFVIQDMY